MTQATPAVGKAELGGFEEPFSQGMEIGLRVEDPMRPVAA